MKTVFAVLAAAGLATAASATTYTDSQNELFDNGFGHLDIASVDVTHDANFITFVINVRGSIDAGAGGSNWGKYCLGIDTGAVGGDAGNGWGRNVSWGSGQGIDFYVGSWADNSFPMGMGGELRQMDGVGGNTLLDATYTTGTLINGSTAAFSQTISISRAAIGMGGNGTFRFDVFSTGGTGSDPGVDHLSRSDAATDGWGTQSVSGQFLSYTIPTPGALALMGMGGLIAARRRRA